MHNLDKKAMMVAKVGLSVLLAAHRRCRRQVNLGSSRIRHHKQKGWYSDFSKAGQKQLLQFFPRIPTSRLHRALRGNGHN
jgi:hypothetical protein